jgi:hypothetical protein
MYFKTATSFCAGDSGLHGVLNNRVRQLPQKQSEITNKAGIEEGWNLFLLMIECCLEV